jgi:DedD protein
MGTSSQDTEITLGTGRMLALFFTFVLVCAVFFAIGFSLGRKTSMLTVNSALSSTNSVSAHSSAGKDTSAKSASQASDFSFYKSVGSDAANTELPPQNSKTQAVAAPVSETQAASSGPSATTAQTNAGYFVQVAAVSRQEDADALVDALKKKQYPAFATNNSSTDKYYHVQVGPYADFKEADAMRSRLVADGYNPIVKK